MDLTTLVIGVAATVVIGAVMMAIAKFGFGGDSDYEQKMARQREILFDDDKSKDKKKKTDKKKKGKPNKAESAGQTSGSELEPEVVRDTVDTVPSSVEEMPPHIEYDPDPVIIEPDQPAPTNRGKKHKKPGPAKSILHNREEVPVVRAADAAVAETVFSETAPPKDDLELRHVKAKKTSGKKQKQATTAVVEEPQPVVDEVVVSTAVKSQATAPVQVAVEEMIVAKTETTVSAALASSGSGSTGPGKKSKAKGGRPVSDLSEIIKIVEDAPLSKDQMQTLVDSVLTRMESEDSWTTKGAKPDPVAVLRKQLEEVQSALAEEQSNVQSAQAKVKEVTTKWSQAEKQCSAAANQNQEFQKRMEHTHEQHKTEVQNLKTAGYQDKQKVEQQIEIISQLSEENQRLKQSVANTDEVTHMQTQLRTLTADKQTLSQKAVETEKTLDEMKHQITRSAENMKSLQTEREELKKRCDELGQRLAQSENSAQQAQVKATEAEKNMKNLQDHVKSQLQDKELEMQTLQDDLSRTKELQLHSATNGSHNGSPNGESGDISALELKISSLEKTVDDKEGQLNNLHKQLAVARNSQSDLSALKQKSADAESQRAELDGQLADLQSQVQTLKDKNNELRRKIWTLNDSLEKAESASLTLAATERDVEDKLCTINELKDRNSKLLSQNNELQEKCDSLSSLNTEVSSLMKQVNESKVSLDSKDKAISQLEKALKEEEQKVAATESECKEILERDFSRKVQGMADEHETRVKQFSNELSAQQQQLNSLESCRNDQQAVIVTLKEDASKSDKEVEKLTNELSAVLREKQQLELDVTELRSESLSTPVTSDSSSLNYYKNALSQVEQMLDGLSGKVESEHCKLTGVLRGKDQLITSVQQRLEETLQQLANTSQVKTDSAKVDVLTKQLEESNKRIMELEKSAADSGTAAKAEAAALAASGGGDDSGTCV